MSAKYSETFKRKAIQRYEKGTAIPKLCEELHIATSTFYRWRNLYCSIQTPQREFTPKGFDSALRSLQKLEHEMEIIRQSGYLSGIPLQQRLATLERLHNTHDEYSIHELCEALEVSRSIARYVL